MIFFIRWEKNTKNRIDLPLKNTSTIYVMSIRILTLLTKLVGHLEWNKSAWRWNPIPIQLAVVRMRPQSDEICPHMDTNEFLAVNNHGCGGNSELKWFDSGKTNPFLTGSFIAILDSSHMYFKYLFWHLGADGLMYPASKQPLFVNIGRLFFITASQRLGSTLICLGCSIFFHHRKIWSSTGIDATFMVLLEFGSLITPSSSRLSALRQFSDKTPSILDFSDLK